MMGCCSLLDTIRTYTGLGFKITFEMTGYDQYTISITNTKKQQKEFPTFSSTVPFNHLHKIEEILEFGYNQVK